jgi:hypothetical protein
VILLWGLKGDGPVACALRFTDWMSRGHSLDQQRVLDTESELCVGSRVAGVLRDGRQTIDLNAVTAVYLRPYDVRRLPVIESAGPGSPEWRHALAARRP